MIPSVIYYLIISVIIHDVYIFRCECEMRSWVWMLVLMCAYGFVGVVGKGEWEPRLWVWV